jgi:hypothetical protein
VKRSSLKTTAPESAGYKLNKEEVMEKKYCDHCGNIIKEEWGDDYLEGKTFCSAVCLDNEWDTIEGIDPSDINIRDEI